MFIHTFDQPTCAHFEHKWDSPSLLSAEMAVFEHCDAGPASHGEGIVARSVIVYAQRTLLQNYCSSERLLECTPRCPDENNSASHTRARGREGGV